MANVYVFSDFEEENFRAFSGEFRTARAIFEMIGGKVLDDEGNEMTKLRLARLIEALDTGGSLDVLDEDDNTTTIRKLEVG